MENVGALERTESRDKELLVVRILLVLVVIASVVAVWWIVQPHGDTGSQLIAQGAMSDEEAQALVNEQAEASRIAISLRPTPELVDGQLHVNFVVPAGNNNFSERLEVEQDGACVYRSGIVEPEHVVKWGEAPLAHAGTAVATVYAVDDSGNDFGNPVSVEIEIVEG